MNPALCHTRKGIPRISCGFDIIRRRIDNDVKTGHLLCDPEELTCIGTVRGQLHISLADVAPKGSAQIVLNEATICLPLGSLIDVSAEKARLEKAIAKTEQETARIAGKLANEKFVANANPDVVAADRERLAELEGQSASLKLALARISEAA